jgi:glycosidase
MKVVKNLFAIVLLSVIYFGTNVQAQDPAQYGTPFSGVPDPQDAVIYQVNMRCFSSTRNFQGVIDRLDNIKALGVNVIYLMPIYPVGTLNAFNSPYCIKDYNSVGAEFGTLTNLRSLIDGAHSKGMAVILDWVANHTAWDHPWISAHKSWYLQNGSGTILSPPGQSWTDVAQLNFSNDTMCNTMIDAMRYWVFTANCDGFRCDYAAGPPASFWSTAITNLRGITTHKLLLFAEGDHSSDYTSGFDYNFSWNFYGNMKQIKDGSTATLIDASNIYDYTGATGTQQVVRWLSNHDIYGSEGSPYTIFGGKAGVMASFVVSAYMKSVPMIYNGMEVGNTAPMTFPFNTSNINWTEDASVTPEMTKIITFRNTSTAIRRGTLTSYDNSDICAFKKVSGNEVVLVVVNLRNAAKTFTLPGNFANATMKDAFTGTDVTLGTSLSLTAYQYKVYTGDASTGIVINTTSDKNFVMYPNPAEYGSITVKIDESYLNSQIDIYDELGRNVYQKILTSLLTNLDLSRLKKGVFVAKLSRDSKEISSQKLVID